MGRPHPTPPTIADGIFTEPILCVDVPCGAIGGRAFSGAPPLDQCKAMGAIHHADDGIEELRRGAVGLMDLSTVPTVD